MARVGRVGIRVLDVGRGRQILVAVWILANVAALALLVVDPQFTQERCETRDLSSGPIEVCTEATRPLNERTSVVIAALVANGVSLAAWVVSKPTSPADTASRGA